MATNSEAETEGVELEALGRIEAISRGLAIILSMS
jgi:hypothetical protein